MAIESQLMQLLEVITNTANALETVAISLNNRVKELEERTEQLERLALLNLHNNTSHETWSH